MTVDVDHGTYGLTMRDELWRAHCGCGWQSVPSPSLSTETEKLHEHLRAVVIADQRTSRVGAVAVASTLGLVDHSRAVGALAVGLTLTAGLLRRVDR